MESEVKKLFESWWSANFSPEYDRRKELAEIAFTAGYQALAAEVERLKGESDEMRRDIVHAHFPRINRLETENSSLQSRVQVLEEALQNLVRCNEEWNASVQMIIGRPVGWNDSYLNEARAALTSTLAETKSVGEQIYDDALARSHIIDKTLAEKP